DQGVCHEAQDHEAGDRPDAACFEVSEFLASMPADCDQEVDRQRLVHNVRELEVDPQNGDKKSEVEEKQQGFEEVVPEVIPELGEDRPGLLLLRRYHAGLLDGDLASGERI